MTNPAPDYKTMRDDPEHRAQVAARWDAMEGFPKGYPEVLPSREAINLIALRCAETSKPKEIR